MAVVRGEAGPAGPAIDERGPWRRLARVVVAIDGLRASEGILALAAGVGDHVMVVHAVEYYIGHLGAFPLISDEEATRVVESAAFEARLHGSAATTAVLWGSGTPVANRIVQAAESWGAQAIVLGSRRIRGVRRLRGRGTREKILRASNLPVLVSPSEPAPEPNGRHVANKRT